MDQPRLAACRLPSLIALLLWLVACGATPAASPPPAASPSLPPGSPGHPLGDAAPSGPPVRFGVLVFRSAVDTTNEWSPLMAYLSERVGRPFELLPIKASDMLGQVEQGTVDFALSNSLVAAQARRLHSSRISATLSSPKTGPLFAGLIIVRNDSPIQSLADVRGKRVGFLSLSSAGGYAFQAAYLLNHGIDPQKDFASATTIDSQDSVALAVLNGTIDVGFVRTGILEGLASKGLISGLDEFRILDRVSDDYLYPHTTPLYPEWAVYALAKTDPALEAQVKSALLSAPAGHQALRAGNVEAFIEPVDYRPIDDLIDTLKLPGSEAPR